MPSVLMQCETGEFVTSGESTPRWVHSQSVDLIPFEFMLSTSVLQNLNASRKIAIDCTISLTASFNEYIVKLVTMEKEL